MNGKESRQGGEEKFAAVLDLGQGEDADGGENSAADEVRCG